MRLAGGADGERHGARRRGGSGAAGERRVVRPAPPRCEPIAVLSERALARDLCCQRDPLPCPPSRSPTCVHVRCVTCLTSATTSMATNERRGVAPQSGARHHSQPMISEMPSIQGRVGRAPLRKADLMKRVMGCGRGWQSASGGAGRFRILRWDEAATRGPIGRREILWCAGSA